MLYRFTETSENARWVTPTISVDETLDVPAVYGPRYGLVTKWKLIVRSDREAYRYLRRMGASRAEARFQILNSHGMFADVSIPTHGI